MIKWLCSLFRRRSSNEVGKTEAQKNTTAKAAWDHLPTKFSWGAWTISALREYGKELLTGPAPRDAKDFCDNFPNDIDGRKRFYLALLSSMAKFESNFKPSTQYQESAKIDNVISRGLLQISIDSANQTRYGCNIKNAKDLHDVETNLIAGVRILNYWLNRDNYIGGIHKNNLGGARYWSCLRTSSKSFAKIKAKVNELMK